MENIYGILLESGGKFTFTDNALIAKVRDTGGLIGANVDFHPTDKSQPVITGIIKEVERFENQEQADAWILIGTK